MPDTIARVPLSVIILTYNEKLNIEACLQSVADWAGEIFIVDSGSTDRTLEIARRYTAGIVSHPFENYSQQRNWAQSNLPLPYDWVFHIDADERVSRELAKLLADFFQRGGNDEVVGLLVRRRIVFMGRWIKHGGLYPTYHRRIFRKDVGRCEDREYDQHFIVDGRVKTLEADLVEVTASSLSSWTQRHDRWAGMEALRLLRAVESSRDDVVHPSLFGSPIERRRWLRASLYERSPLFLRALLYFLVRYVVRGGFLDGIPGLIYHVLHGFWYRFYTDARLYELLQSGAERSSSTSTKENGL